MATDKRSRGWIISLDKEKLSAEENADLTNSSLYQYTAWCSIDGGICVLLYLPDAKTRPGTIWRDYDYEPLGQFSKYVSEHVDIVRWKEFGTRPELGSRLAAMKKKELYTESTIAQQVYGRFADLRELAEGLRRATADVYQLQKDLIEEEMDVYVTDEMEIRSYADSLEAVALIIARGRSDPIPAEFHEYAKSLRQRDRKRTDEEKAEMVRPYFSKRVKRSETKEEKSAHRMKIEQRVVADATAWRRLAGERQQATNKAKRDRMQAKFE